MLLALKANQFIPPWIYIIYLLMLMSSIVIMNVVTESQVDDRAEPCSEK